MLFLTAWNAAGYHQGDEHFQVLEFAASKAGTVAAADLPWEFGEQMRPGLQPLMAYGMYRFLGLFGEVNPFFMAFVLRLLSAALFLHVCRAIFKRYGRAFRDLTNRRWFGLMLLFTWCNIYAGVRFSSESWSGAMFVLGFLAYPLPLSSYNLARPRVPGPGSGALAFLAGIYFGLSFEFRYQLALAVVGFVLWLLFVGKPNWKHLFLLVIGGVCVLGLGSLADYWLYGDWVIAPWNYLSQNLIEGKAAGFGTKPWYGYIEYIFERGIPPISIIYLLAIAYFCIRYYKDPITWSFLLFFIAHSALSRKDIRFLFPMLPFLPIALTVLMRDIRNRKGDRAFKKGWRSWVFGLMITLNCGLLITVMFRSMNSNMALMEYVYEQYDGPVTILADGKHLYNHSDLLVRFYQPETRVRIVQAKDRNWPACPTKICLYSQLTREEDPPPGFKLVYSNAPTFLGNFDPFGLVSKQNFWYLYERQE